jgi:hypothetical protein
MFMPVDGGALDRVPGVMYVVAAACRGAEWMVSTCFCSRKIGSVVAGASLVPLPVASGIELGKGIY